jgi:uncharacterized membrane protein YozB (DUF420 family)
MTTDVRSDSGAARGLIFALSLVVTVAAMLVVYLTPRQTVVGEPSLLANLNALLNAAASCALVGGYVQIRRGKRESHRAYMLVAFGVSAVFLVTYLLHHAQVGSVPFRGEGLIRTIYFAILVPHIVLAAVVLPLALLTLYRGLSSRFVLHKKIARWTLPLWLFVSVSGVVVYLMLYYAA